MKKDQKKLIEERQKVLNTKLAEYFKNNGVKKLRLTSMGNSIASGYSMVRTIRPLLLRNESIEDIMNNNDITLERYNFARAQNNNDEHLFEWLELNMKESDIHKMNRVDYSNMETSMINHGVDDFIKDKYYSLNDKTEKGLKDLVTENEDGFANIIVYNGCTGSFLDALTRKGAIRQQLLYGVKRDLVSLEATLKLIQTNNRLKNSNTQVYLCGAPNYLGTRISEIINRKLKKLCKNYSNVVYVEPVKAKMVYDKLKTDEYYELSKFKRHIKSVDFHYNEEEYLKLNNNIIETIYNNYAITKAMINLDRNLYSFSKNIELENDQLYKDGTIKKKELYNIIDKELKNIEDLNSKKEFLRKIEKYILKRYSYDFYYLGKKEVKVSIQDVNSSIKK